MRLRFFSILVTSLILALPLSTSAHTTGASWNIASGPYTVDVGYDPTTFTAGIYTRFDFLLWKGPANTGDPVDYAQIWVRIVRAGNDTVLATGIWKQPVGPTTLLYEFQEPGSYSLEVSYRDQDGNDIAIASIPITVQAGDTSSSSLSTLILAFAVGILVGASGYFLVRRARR